jgi:uncharacterized protein (TIGR02452 family)
MNREKRITTAAETVAILDAGTYNSPAGRAITIADSLRASIYKTCAVAPEEWPVILEAAAALPRPTNSPAIEVTDETTLAAARRLHRADAAADLLALNFASAKNPGGGFLTGSEAQEESIARASGLYKTLLAAQSYYTLNRKFGSLLYSDYAILSPNVPVFRDDHDTLLENSWPLSVHTAPAPNRGAMDLDSSILAEIPATFRRRMTHLFALAATTNHRRIILGAWGCGVFCNDPAEVAQLFAETLFRDRWAAHFTHICFAVYDTSPNQSTRNAFARVLAPYIRKEQP